MCGWVGSEEEGKGVAAAARGKVSVSSSSSQSGDNARRRRKHVWVGCVSVLTNPEMQIDHPIDHRLNLWCEIGGLLCPRKPVKMVSWASVLPGALQDSGPKSVR